MDQIGLFGPAPPPVGPAAEARALQPLAAALPRTLRLGPASWAWPGWAHLVYDRAAEESVLARHGLAALARHPLYRTACLDRTYHRPHTRDEWRALAADLPDGFRLLSEAPQACVQAVFPRVARYGDRAGQPNPHFLDPAWAAEAVVGPWAEGLADRCGPLLFQFPPQHPAELGGADRFPARLRAFFAALPPPPPTGRYAVELRDPGLQTPALAEALHAVGVLPALVVHPRMPDLRTQWRQAGVGRAGPVVLRWMLQRGLDPETARQRFAPFAELAAPDPATRSTIARLVRAMAEAGRPTWVVVGNHAEGCAPRSIEALARVIAGAAGGPASGEGGR